VSSHASRTIFRQLRSAKDRSPRLAAAEESAHVVQQNLAEGLVSPPRISHYSKRLAGNQQRIVGMPPINTISQWPSGTAPLGVFSIFRRHRAKRAIVPAVEIAGIKKGFVGRWSSARAPFRGSVLFPDAGGGSGHRPSRHCHLRGLWDGSDRTGLCRACSGAKCRFHSIGGTFLGRSRRDRKECGQRAVAGDNR